MKGSPSKLITQQSEKSDMQREDQEIVRIIVRSTVKQTYSHIYQLIGIHAHASIHCICTSHIYVECKHIHYIDGNKQIDHEKE